MADHVTPDVPAGPSDDGAVLAQQLVAAMEREFGDDHKRIGHALSVLRWARELSRDEGGDARVVLAAAVLHDIGILEAERKHGWSGARYQEPEGPPIARRIMEGIGLGARTIDHVCRIVGSHHSARDIDTLEFRIIWDADHLVNIPETLRESGRHQYRGNIDTSFKTGAGREMAHRYAARCEVAGPLCRRRAAAFRVRQSPGRAPVGPNGAASVSPRHTPDVLTVIHTCPTCLRWRSPTGTLVQC